MRKTDKQNLTLFDLAFAEEKIKNLQSELNKWIDKRDKIKIKIHETKEQ